VRIAVVIPWRASGDEDRDLAFDYTRAYYLRLEAAGVVDEVVVSSDGADSGPFNRHRAYNLGYARTDADVVLWNEADTLIPAEQIATAAALAEDEPGLVVPYSERHELDVTQAARVYAGTDPFTLTGTVVYADGVSIGQAGVTSRATMGRVGGGWDERFQGWGFDDNAAFHIFGVLAGPPRIVEGRGVHLWHLPAFHVHTPEREARTDANAARFAFIRSLSPDDLRAYVGAV
jgi:hypothetical protein